MGLKNILHRPTQFDANTLVRLTSDGDAAITEDKVIGIDQFAIMVKLQEKSPRSLTNISRETDIPIQRTRDEVSKLRRNNPPWVQLVED